MRKNVLALSIAAMIGGLGFAGAASAGVLGGTTTTAQGATTVYDSGFLGAANASKFSVSQGGVGHQLIVPYFTTQAGNTSVIHIVNTDTSNGKALKVRFRGASNSDDIMDLQVLLSPGDVWTAAVGQGSDGISTLTTYDNTCTYPKLTKGVAQSFVTSRLNQNLTAAQIAENTREGYVEIFNMADIPSDKLYGAQKTANSALYSTIKHVATTETPACDSAVLDAVLLTNYTVESAAAAVGFATPTGGLLGDWYIINTANTTVFSGSDTALVANGRGNFVFFPQLADAVTNPEFFTADPALASSGTAVTAKTSTGGGTATTAAVVAAAYYDLPDLSTPYLTGTNTGNITGPRIQAATLTGQLAVTSITNEYARDPSIAAQTDWVFSMPTRRYSVALDYSTTTNGVSTPTPVYSYVGAGNNGGTTTIPTAGLNPQYFSKDNTKVVNGQICVNADGQSFWSREESVASQSAVFSPSQLTTYRFCGETSVLSFSATSPLGANLARQTTAAGYTNGWGVVRTSNTTGGSALGLPILGSSFIKLTNTAVTPNVNFGLTLPHRFVSAGAL